MSSEMAIKVELQNDIERQDAALTTRMRSLIEKQTDQASTTRQSTISRVP